MYSFVKNNISLILSSIGITFLIGIMASMVWIGAAMMDTHYQHRIDVNEWIEEEKKAVQQLEKYVQTGQETHYDSFKKQVDELKWEVQLGNYILNPPENKDSTIAYLSAQTRRSPEEIRNSIWIFEWLGDYKMVKEATRRWRQMAQTIHQVDSVGSSIHASMNKPGSSATPSNLQHKLDQLKLTLLKQENKIQATLPESTNWLKNKIQQGILISSGFLWLIFISGLILYHRNKNKNEQKLFEKQRKLELNRKKFSNLFNNSPLAVVYLDQSLNILEANQSFEELFGYRMEEIKHQRANTFITPDHKLQEGRKIDEQTKEGKSITKQTVRVDKEGNSIHVILSTVPVYIEGEIAGIFGIYTDITEQISVQRELENAIEEREILIQEIHHRVKNNLAVTAGLLELQTQYTHHEETQAKLEDSISRIQSMAMIHELLYQNDSYINVTFNDYLSRLIEYTSSLIREEKEISITADSDPIQLNINQAVPCALLVNELITNALKHAFSDRTGGHISLELNKIDHSDTVRISVKDDGRGLPDEALDQMDSMGMNIIHNLVEQLEGDITFNSNGGTNVEIVFSAEDLKGPYSNI